VHWQSGTNVHPSHTEYPQRAQHCWWRVEGL